MCVAEEAARLRAHANSLEDLEKARALRAQQARAAAKLEEDLDTESKTRKAALESRLRGRA